MLLAQAAETAPSSPLRVIAIVFITVFLSLAALRLAAASAEPAASGSRATQPIRPAHETILANPRNHPETDRAYTSVQQTARRRLGGIT